MTRSLYRNSDYDLLRDFEFVALLGTGPTVPLSTRMSASNSISSTGVEE